MDPYETQVETAHRHVIEAEAQLAFQMVVIADLASEDYDTTTAEDLLATLTDTLRFMRQALVLAQKEQQVAQGRHPNR